MKYIIRPEVLKGYSIIAVDIIEEHDTYYLVSIPKYHNYAFQEIMIDKKYVFDSKQEAMRYIKVELVNE